MENWRLVFYIKEGLVGLSWIVGLMVVRKVENGQFKAEKWSGHLIQTDTWLDKLLFFFFFTTSFSTAVEVLKG